MTSANTSIHMSLGSLSTYRVGVHERQPLTLLAPNGHIHAELRITIGDQVVPVLDRDSSQQETATESVAVKMEVMRRMSLYGALLGLFSTVLAAFAPFVVCRY